MGKRSGAVFALFMSFASFVHADEFCVQTFNAYGPFYALDKKDRAQALIEELDEQRLCALNHFQEVWTVAQYERLTAGFSKSEPLAFSLLHDQDRNDGWRTGLVSVTPASSELRLVGRGSARFKLDRQSWIDRLRGLSKVWKAFSFVEVRRATGERLHSLNLHLHPETSAIRVGQLVELEQWIRTRAGKGANAQAVIVSGDFNANPGTLEWRFLTSFMDLTDGFVQANGQYFKTDCTYCVGNPLSWGKTKDKVLDYVFYRSGADLRLSAKMAKINLTHRGGVFFSDHYGVRVWFDAEPAPRAWAPAASQQSAAPELHYADPAAARAVLLEAERLLVDTDALRYKDAIQQIRRWLAEF